MVELQTERGGERRRVGRADVVGRDTATGAEVAEVERRPLIAPLRPPAHSIWATFLPPRSAAWANVSACSTPGVPNADVLLANGWPLTWNVLFVEPCDARPRAGRQREPSGAGVRRRLRQQTVVGCLGAVLQQVAEAWHHALLRVLLDGVLAQAVGREEQQLVRAVITVTAADHRCDGEASTPTPARSRPAARPRRRPRPDADHASTHEQTHRMT